MMDEDEVLAPHGIITYVSRAYVSGPSWKAPIPRDPSFTGIDCPTCKSRVRLAVPVTCAVDHECPGTWTILPLPDDKQ